VLVACVLSFAAILWSSRPFTAVALLFACIVVGVGIVQTSSSSGASLAVRQQLWSVGRQLIAEHPIFGVGLGQFEPQYQRVLHERFSQFNSGLLSPEPIPEFVFRDPHNWIIAFWLNAGLLGLVAFIGVHIVAVWRSKERGVVLALVLLLLFGLVDTIYWKNDLATLHWVLISLTLASR